ncbi:hypothetical protein E2C01_035389 [Portunus trituberculatus]|uniref:Uncharacterized protein n=1 Tax=Portunus trituberculatus TaxID=210409 RepID=A0A5B7FBC2_PORTR|nr:hypothetical protein [Portunus trituberculatus]
MLSPCVVLIVLAAAVSGQWSIPMRQNLLPALFPSHFKARHPLALEQWYGWTNALHAKPTSTGSKTLSYCARLWFLLALRSPGSRIICLCCVRCL